MSREIAEREKAGLPPFGRLAGIIVSAATRAEAESHARGLQPRRTPIIRHPGARPGRGAAGAARPAATASVCWCMASAAPTCRAIIRALLAAGPKIRGSVRVAVDIDPQSFL